MKKSIQKLLEEEYSSTAAQANKARVAKPVPAPAAPVPVKTKQELYDILGPLIGAWDASVQPDRPKRTRREHRVNH